MDEKEENNKSDSFIKEQVNKFEDKHKKQNRMRKIIKAIKVVVSQVSTTLIVLTVSIILIVFLCRFIVCRR